MYRKLMMLLAVVSVLGLAIGLVGCPQQPPPPSTSSTPPPIGSPGPSLEEVEEAIEAEEMEEEATDE